MYLNHISNRINKYKKRSINFITLKTLQLLKYIFIQCAKAVQTHIFVNVTFPSLKLLVVEDKTVSASIFTFFRMMEAIIKRQILQPKFFMNDFEDFQL